MQVLCPMCGKMIDTLHYCNLPTAPAALLYDIGAAGIRRTIPPPPTFTPLVHRWQCLRCGAIGELASEWGPWSPQHCGCPMVRIN